MQVYVALAGGADPALLIGASSTSFRVHEFDLYQQFRAKLAIIDLPSIALSRSGVRGASKGCGSDTTHRPEGGVLPRRRRPLPRPHHPPG